MDIYSERGAKVVFANPDNGYEHHIETAAKYLVVGQTYTVEYTDVGDWHTDVHLQEVPDVAFNSVMFEDIQD